MTASPLVIYHKSDYDGIFCREIARHFLSDPELVGWEYGEPKVPLPPAPRQVYVLDLSPDCLTDGDMGTRVIWIDHHKSAIEKYGNCLPGYRIDGVAACRLAWQWFSPCDAPHLPGRMMPPASLPTKEDFVERRVVEPLAVRLAGEYDIWDKRDISAETFQFGLRCADHIDWRALFSSTICNEGTGMDIVEGNLAASVLLQDGFVAQRYQKKIDKTLMESRSFEMDWEGLRWLCVNTGRFNSLTFESRDNGEYEGLLGFAWNGPQGQWTVSLYHARNHEDLDLSKIAVKYGGGGHRGACGFTCQFLPFALVTPFNEKRPFEKT